MYTRMKRGSEGWGSPTYAANAYQICKDQYYTKYDV